MENRNFCIEEISQFWFVEKSFVQVVDCERNFVESCF